MTIEDEMNKYEQIYQHPMVGPRMKRTSRLCGTGFVLTSTLMEGMYYYFTNQGILSFDFSKMDLADVGMAYIFADGLASLITGRAFYLGLNVMKYSSRLIKKPFRKERNQKP